MPEVKKEQDAEVKEVENIIFQEPLPTSKKRTFKIKNITSPVVKREREVDQPVKKPRRKTPANNKENQTP